MNNLRQIYLVMKMIEEDLGHMPETVWELFGLPPDHPARKQHPNRQFYTGPWWRCAKTCFVCPTVRASEAWGKGYTCNDPTILPPGTYNFPNLTWGLDVKRGRVRREPKAPPTNATLASCGGVTETGCVFFHNLGIDLSGRVGRRYTPPENYKAMRDLFLYGQDRLTYPIGWDLVK